MRENKFVCTAEEQDEQRAEFLQFIGYDGPILNSFYRHFLELWTTRTP
jgi:hypothetical protein